MNGAGKDKEKRMGKILVISETDVRRCLTMSMAIDGVVSAYVQKTSGEGVIFPLVCHDFITGRADMDIKSGEAKDSGIFGLKVVTWFGDNVSLGLPALSATTLLMDNATGLLLAMLNASGITGMRTGAAGAVGIKYLARPESEVMLMVGCGGQAPYAIAAVLTAMGHVRQIFLYEPVDPESVALKAGAIRTAVDEILGADRSASAKDNEKGSALDYELIPVTDLEHSVRTSDIIVTATPSRKPLIKKEWVRPGTHISAMGADMSGKQELDAQILETALVFADDRNQSMTVGECEGAVKEGLIAAEKITEIGDVIQGSAPGRRSEKDITVFDSSGIALQDLIVAKEIYDQAKAGGLGTWVQL